MLPRIARTESNICWPGCTCGQSYTFQHTKSSSPPKFISDTNNLWIIVYIVVAKPRILEVSAQKLNLPEAWTQHILQNMSKDYNDSEISRWLPWNISFCPLPFPGPSSQHRKTQPSRRKHRRGAMLGGNGSPGWTNLSSLSPWGDEIKSCPPPAADVVQIYVTVWNCCALPPSKTVLSEVDCKVGSTHKATFRIKCCSHLQH